MTPAPQKLPATTYQPDEVETRIHARDLKRGVFAAGGGGRPFSLMMPPPNVTGGLHIGHALDLTLQDILTRYHRMRGFDTLWQPGTDHAGIATQLLVERKLRKEDGVERSALGRDAFLARVWQWKERYGGRILEQMHRLLLSADWPRLRFTLDEELSKAVSVAFVRLYRQKLIYRGQRLVNWDPELATALSDLEVENRETKGRMWYIRYPLADGGGRFITVATTRPETMAGDVAVAVHPDDPRYKRLIGGHCLLPVFGGRLPIIADAHADPQKGSGVVKITPAHDFHDFAVGQRHHLTPRNVFDHKARYNDSLPSPWRGLDRFAARKRIVAMLEAQGLLEKSEETVIAIPFGDRSGAIIEPLLTDQWFLDARRLAGPAMDAVEKGETVFVPDVWTKTYLQWLREVQPWCISRQLWWGHRIPAWYGDDGQVFVAENESEALAAAARHYGKETALRQDEDVLDTWFSSSLWPFSTLGWPQQSSDLKRYYPTGVLVTAFDIIFFWVARMVMMGIHFTGKTPFRKVYIHALVRDAKGRKMSKSRGNTVDPMSMMAAYGADALRFTLAALASPGRDLRFSEERLRGYRNFATKIWNAARFCLLHECRLEDGFTPFHSPEPLNRWIADKAAAAAGDTKEALDRGRFDEACGALHHFVRDSFCDWYLELAKPRLNGEDGALKRETRHTAAWTLDLTLRLLHPFMPGLSSALWDSLRGREDESLAAQPWPQAQLAPDEKAARHIAFLQKTVMQLRALRNDLGVPAHKRLTLFARNVNDEARDIVRRNEQAVGTLARLEKVDYDVTPPDGSVELTIEGSRLALPLAGVIDVGRTRLRLARAMEEALHLVAQCDGKLASSEFLAKAPEGVVTRQRLKRARAATASESCRAALGRLDAAGL